MAPFDLIYYRNQSKLANLRDYNTKELVPLPAIVLYYDDNVQSLQTTGDAIQLTVDLATLVIPGGQLTSLGKVLFLLDKASSITSIGSEVLKNENPEASKLLNVLSLAFGVVDVANITKVNAVKKLNNSLDDNLKDFDKVLNTLEDVDTKTIAKLTDDNKKGVKKLIKIESQALKDAGKSVDDARINSVLNKLDATDAIFDITKSYKGVKFEEFVKGTWGLDQFDKKIQENVFKLWTKIESKNEEGVTELFDYMLKSKVNLDADGKTPWPPFNGFLRKPEIISGKELISGTTNFTSGKAFEGIYDRFQTPRVLENGDIQSIENLGGGFASPVFKGEYNKIDIPYTYDSRALLDNIQEGTVYIKFRIKDPNGLSFKYGEALPWKNRAQGKLQGKAMQVQIENIKFHSEGFKGKYDIVQKSIYRNKKWHHEINDLSETVDNIMGNLKKCD